MLATAASFSILTRIKSAWSANEKLTAKGLDHVNSLRDIAGVGVVVDEGPQPIDEEAGYALCYRVLRRLAMSPYVREVTDLKSSMGEEAAATVRSTPRSYPRRPGYRVRDPGPDAGHGWHGDPRLGGAHRSLQVHGRRRRAASRRGVNLAASCRATGTDHRTDHRASFMQKYALEPASAGM